MRTSRPFSFLEVMVGLALLLMVAGSIGWKMQGFLEKKRFQADIKQLKSRLQSIHRMAVNMQADWEGILQREGKQWTFEAICLDPPKSKSFSAMRLHVSEISFNGKIQQSFPFFFFASGEIWPLGILQIQQMKGGEAAILKIPDLFGHAEGDGVRNLGPIHPDGA